MQLFLQNYLTFIGALLFFWTIGSLLKGICKLKEPFSYASSFSSLLIGIVAFTTITAITATWGKTILSSVVLLCIPLFWGYRSFFAKKEELCNLQTIPSLSKKMLVTFIFLALNVIFFIRYLTIHSEANILSIPHADYLTYTRLSCFLLQTGVEHILTNPILPPDGVTPYHYFENWLNAGIAFVSNSNYLQNLMLVVYSVLIFTTWLGFCAVLDKLPIAKTFIPLWAFLGTLIAGLYLPFLYDKFEFLRRMRMFTYNEWNHHKLSVIYVFLLASILAFVQNKKYLAYLLLLFLPIFYTTTAPAIFGGLFLYSLLLFFRKQKQEAIWILAHTFAVAVFLGGFYWLFASKNMNTTPSIRIEELLGDVRTKINIIGGATLHLSILYAFTLPILWLSRKELIFYLKEKIFVFLAFLLPAVALGSWALLSFNVDAVQIFSNITTPLINILLLLLIAYQSSKKKIFSYLYAVIILTGFFLAIDEFQVKKNIEPSQLEVLQNHLQYTNLLGISWRESKEFSDLFSKNINVYMLGNYLTTLFSEAFVVELNVHQIPVDSSSRYARAEIAMIKNSPFYRYTEKQKKEGKFKNLEQSHLDFIKEYNIKFLVANKDTQLPTHLQKLVAKELIYQSQKICMFEDIKIK